MVVRWTFNDPATSTTVTFSINPYEGGSVKRSRNVVGTPTTAPDGTPVFFEGQRAPRTSSFKVKVRTEDEYDFFDTWADKHNPIELTDDLGRTFTIIITEFDPQRTRKAHTPWHHDCTVNYIVLSES